MTKKLLLTLIYCISIESSFDLTIFGPAIYADGLGRLPIIYTDMLKHDLNINFFSTKLNLDGSTDEIKSLFKKTKLGWGKVIFYTKGLWYKNDAPKINLPVSSMRIAYSMLESTLIPDEWIKILNDDFDAVAVPDIAIKEFYINSGVKIPIFVLPHPIYLDNFLNSKKKDRNEQNEQFVFGCSAQIIVKKNQIAIIKAFAECFANNPNFKLILHGRSSSNYKDKVIEEIKNLGLTTVEFINKILSEQEYLDLFKSFDCYILVSKGEGFSVTPREALALGIPCIVSNNTAQKTICQTGFVRAVESNILKPAYYTLFGFESGYDFDCDISDVADAMQDVFANYQEYCIKAQMGREWVKQYSINSLRARTLNLFKPKKIIFGQENSLSENGLTTSSYKLYSKYKKIFNLK